MEIFGLTPSRVRELACDGNPLLSAIRRDETFVGARLLKKGHIIERARDYEFARPTVNECERAIRMLGKRIESCLAGKPMARDFATREIGAGGVDPMSKWTGEEVTLYSLGPAPMLLDSDRIVIFRGERGNEVRFGYYANTGPTEAE